MATIFFVCVWPPFFKNCQIKTPKMKRVMRPSNSRISEEMLENTGMKRVFLPESWVSFQPSLKLCEGLERSSNGKIKQLFHLTNGGIRVHDQDTIQRIWFSLHTTHLPPEKAKLVCGDKGDPVIPRRLLKNIFFLVRDLVQSRARAPHV